MSRASRNAARLSPERRDQSQPRMPVVPPKTGTTSDDLAVEPALVAMGRANAYEHLVGEHEGFTRDMPLQQQAERHDQLHADGTITDHHHASAHAAMPESE